MSSTRSRSPPELNAPSAPRTTTTRVSGSRSIVCQIAARCACASAPTALSFPGVSERDAEDPVLGTVDLETRKLVVHVEEPNVLVERDGRVGIVLMNRPKQLNALSGELMEAVVGCPDRARRRSRDPRDRARRWRARIRRGRRHRRALRCHAGDAVREPEARSLGRDPEGADADRRRRVRVLPRRRLRAGDALRPGRRLGERRSSVSPRSTSACFQAPAARSASRARSARRSRWT